jgi:hypothetical protein
VQQVELAAGYKDFRFQSRLPAVFHALSSFLNPAVGRQHHMKPWTTKLVCPVKQPVLDLINNGLTCTIDDGTPIDRLVRPGSYSGLQLFIGLPV